MERCIKAFERWLDKHHEEMRLEQIYDDDIAIVYDESDGSKHFMVLMLHEPGKEFIDPSKRDVYRAKLERAMVTYAEEYHLFEDESRWHVDMFEATPVKEQDFALIRVTYDL